MWLIIKEFLLYYVMYPVIFIFVYGGILIALVRERMREENRYQKFGF